MKKIYGAQIFEKVKIMYIIFLIIYCFGHHSPYTYDLFNDTVFEILIILFTVFIAIPDLLHIKDYLRIKHLKLIIFLLMCIAASNLLNFCKGGDLIGNARFYFWIFVYGLVIYPLFARKSREENWTALKVVNWAFLSCAFLLSFLSMLSMYIPFPQVANSYYESYIYTIPFFANRFFGIYSDPNIGSLIGILSIGSSLILLNETGENKQKKHIMWVLFIINLLVQVSYIFCCDSRSGLLALICTTFLGCIIYFTCSVPVGKSTHLFKAILISMLLSAGIFFMGTGLKILSQYLYAYETIYIQNKNRENNENRENSENSENIDKKDYDKKQEEKQPVNLYGRTDATSSSQIRLVVWSQAIRAVKEKPLLGGTARDTGKYLKDYATEETKDMMCGANLHNVYIYGVLTTGILSIGCWFCLVIKAAKNTFMNCYVIERDIGRKRNIAIIIAMFLAMHLVACFFNILYVVPGLITYLHWMLLGILEGINDMKKATHNSP